MSKHIQLPIQLPTLHKVVGMCNTNKQVTPFYGKLLSIDPGETTGVAVWMHTPEQLILQHIDQLATPDIGKFYNEFTTLFVEDTPDRMIIERYAVYSWKTDQHAWSDIPTLRIIGAIELMAEQQRIPRGFQTAQQAKQFVTDDFLKRYGCYFTGVKHARDAIRHGIYYLMFGSPKAQQKAS